MKVIKCCDLASDQHYDSRLRFAWGVVLQFYQIICCVAILFRSWFWSRACHLLDVCSASYVHFFSQTLQVDLQLCFWCEWTKGSAAPWRGCMSTMSTTCRCANAKFKSWWVAENAGFLCLSFLPERGCFSVVKATHEGVCRKLGFLHLPFALLFLFAWVKQPQIQPFAQDVRTVADFANRRPQQGRPVFIHLALGELLFSQYCLTRSSLVGGRLQEWGFGSLYLDINYWYAILFTMGCFFFIEQTNRCLRFVNYFYILSVKTVFCHQQRIWVFISIVVVNCCALAFKWAVKTAEKPCCFLLLKQLKQDICYFSSFFLEKPESFILIHSWIKGGRLVKKKLCRIWNILCLLKPNG